MKKYRYLAEAAFLHSLFFVFRLLPLDVASSLGGWIGRNTGPRLAASRKAYANLHMLRPDMSQAEQRRIVRGMWNNLGRVIAEYPHLGQIGQERVEVVGGSIIEALIRDKKPAIFFTGHLANWEVIVTGAQAQAGLQLGVIYRAPNNPYVDRLIDSIRSQKGRVLTIPKSQRGVRHTIEALKAGRSVGMLIDQKYNEGMNVPLLGRPAMSSSAYAQLAQKFGCPLIPTRVERLGGAHFRITCHPSLPLNGPDGMPRPVEDIVADAHACLEDWIWQRPEQWLWLHRRWSSAALKAS